MTVGNWAKWWNWSVTRRYVKCKRDVKHTNKETNRVIPAGAILTKKRLIVDIKKALVLKIRFWHWKYDFVLGLFN